MQTKQPRNKETKKKYQEDEFHGNFHTSVDLCTAGTLPQRSIHDTLGVF